VADDSVADNSVAADDATADRRPNVLAALRSQGGRLTAARRALIDALLGADSHVTADDLADAVHARHPEVHRSTIYRTLDALEQAGIVDHVHLGHGRAVYHLADDTHQHLVCDSCGHVIEVPDALFDDLATRLRKGYGFTIRPHHFAVLGRCRACR
jgi:Fe2+ or Zn2+ uptake regulation protein